MALNGLICADVPLRNYSLTHSHNLLATNISLLPLWMNYSELQMYIASLILQKKLIFTASYDVYKHFYSSYLALILQ